MSVMLSIRFVRDLDYSSSHVRDFTLRVMASETPVELIGYDPDRVWQVTMTTLKGLIFRADLVLL
jgi:hypothetical protein